MVPFSAGVQSLVFELGPTTGRPVCNPVQSQTSQVCITGTGSDSLGCRQPESAMGESGCLRVSSSLSAQPSDLQVVVGTVKPVTGFSFVSGKNNEIRKEYLGTGT